MFKLKRKQDGGGKDPKKKKVSVFDTADHSDDESEEVKMQKAMKQKALQVEKELEGQTYDLSHTENMTPTEVSSEPNIADSPKEGSKYITKLLEAQKKREQDKEEVKQRHLDQKIKESGALVFETDAYKSQKGQLIRGNETPVLSVKETMEQTAVSEEQSLEQLAAKYNIDYAQLKVFIKTKMVSQEIESYKLRYFERTSTV